MRILLLGCNGQVGWELQRALNPLGDVVACDFDSPGDLAADFARPQSLPKLVERVQPGLIVNAAAHTAVDKAEAEQGLARAINATSPGVLAHEAMRLGVPLIHYSTDYVFNGSGDHARDEGAATGPLSVYGRTKLEGEELIRTSGCVHLILRTSWVYAARGGNFAKTMLRLASERDSLNVIHDQIGAPTSAELLADITAHVARALLGRAELAGTYHCVASGATSWFDYARLVIAYARAQGFPVRVEANSIKPIATRDYPTPAQRPLNSRLDTNKLRHTFGLNLPPWQQGVERLLAEVLPR